ncbi:MAG: amino acid racemase [Planctomycetota bacterium]
MEHLRGSKHIGIIGCTPAGGASCYRLIAGRLSELDTDAERPTITLHSPPASSYMQAIEAGEWERVAELLADAARALARCGADFCVLPDNTAHHALPMAEVDAPLEIVNMVELVADHVRTMQCSTVGLIGTTYVTRGSTYQTALGLRGVRLLVPPVEEADELDEIIFRQAAYGRVTAESRHRVQRAVERLAARGCEAVILGYSESSVMFDVASIAHRLVDPVELLGDAAVAAATSAAQAA